MFGFLIERAIFKTYACIIFLNHRILSWIQHLRNFEQIEIVSSMFVQLYCLHYTYPCIETSSQIVKASGVLVLFYNNQTSSTSFYSSNDHSNLLSSRKLKGFLIDIFYGNWNVLFNYFMFLYLKIICLLYHHSLCGI